MPSPILRIAVPSPLRRLFDYLPPRGCTDSILPGQRLRVPFGRGETVGILVEVAEASELPSTKLRHAGELLDRIPLLPDTLVQLLRWASAYYHHPPGEVWHTALPVLLRQGRSSQPSPHWRWRITDAGRRALAEETFARAPRQRALLHQIAEAGETGLNESALNETLDDWRPVARRLLEKEWLLRDAAPAEVARHARIAGPTLNPDQAHAVTAINEASGRFQPLLLEGVTGSGKTEVYLQAIDHCLQRERQALVLVPEIGLTPQLLDRFRRRLDVPMAVLHSGMTDHERLVAWHEAASGRARVVIGTRSAVFTPLEAPGLLIIDEEHDASLKQQDGFRYSARDVAVMRAQLETTPIVLGSATPSLESLANVERGRYQRLHLPRRAGDALPPPMRLVDMRSQPMAQGLSRPLINAVHAHLDEGGQVLLFLNRRGFAPTLLCHDCGWVSHCQRCDSHMTLHAAEGRLRCHHCGAERPRPPRCPDCGSSELRPVGQGTERLEQVLREHFAEVPLVRIDRDSTRRKGSIDALLEQVRSGEGRLLVGTQMIAKGHHFPRVTLVAIVDADQGLFSLDFRAGERLAQQVIQVAGRAGRADRPGEVLIQTHQPEHPLLLQLARQGYAAFAAAALEERRLAALPPYGYLALLRAEAVSRQAAQGFLEFARQLGEPLIEGEAMLFGPVPSPMEKRAGRYRAQLLVQTSQRQPLHQLLDRWIPLIEGSKEARKVRWSLDVDPQEMF